MTRGPVDGKLLLSYLWAIPMSSGESDQVFARARENALLKRLDGKLRDDWAAAEAFLFLEGEPLNRWVLATSPLAAAIGDETLRCELIVTWHPGYRAMTLVVALTVADSGTVSARDFDRAIALVQSFQGRPCAHPGRDAEIHGRYRKTPFPSVRAAVDAVFDELTAGTVDEEMKRGAWCVELRAAHGHPADKTVPADPRPFYGLATGDEGWRFVPNAVAATALGEPWGTREFVAVYSMATGIICINHKGADYVERQHEFTREHFGQAEPYFALDTAVAGLDHGALFVLERVLVRLALADRWLHSAHPELTGPDRARDAATRTRLLRGSLDDILQLLNALLPPEVDSLERRVSTRMGVERTIQQLDRQAEAMDEETRYAYESVVSARVTRLTAVTVVLTVVTIVLGVLQVLVSL